MVKVLCIEDEPAIRIEIAEELMDAGYDTLQASNGEEGLEVIRQVQPDLIVCDITMPVMDGHELLRTLRREHPEMSEIPFVFLSALADRDAMIEGRKLGADAYLTKPIDFELLLVEIESRLSQVGRMTQTKQQELVKLYKAMSKDEAAEAPAAEAGVLGTVPETAQLSCRPIRTREGKLCPMSRCTLDDQSLARAAEIEETEGEPGIVAVELDLLLLSKVEEKISEDLEAGSPTLLITQVHFSTLSEEDHTKRFESACGQLAEPVRRQLGLEIIGMPPALLPSRMQLMCEATASLGRVKVLELAQDGILVLSELSASFRLVSATLADLNKLAAGKRDQLDKAVAYLRAKGTKVMIKNVEDGGLPEKLAHLNVDFVS